MTRRCIVFDLDDTLYLERDYVRSGFCAVGDWAAAELGLAGFGDEAWQMFCSGRRERVFESVLAGRGSDPEPALVARLVGVYRGHVPQIALLPDAIRCLDEVRRTAFTGLITDGSPTRQAAKCASLEVADKLDRIVCTGEWGEQFSKPHERAFRFFEQHVEGNCSFVYVADNPSKDFHAPRALGWQTVRIRRAEGLHYAKESSPEFQPDFELPDMRQLPDLLAS